MANERDGNDRDGNGRDGDGQGRGPSREEQDRRESQRILKHVSQEAEVGGRSVIDRAASRARNHLAASDVDRDDRVEYWGTRIGRTIGAVFLGGLIVWLVFYLAGND